MHLRVPRAAAALVVVPVALALAVTAAIASNGGTAAPHAATARKDTYTIYLSNNFLGNDWRQQMERVARVVVRKRPLRGRVNLRIENVETTVQAQINSLNNIIRRRPDAILIDAGSGTALNPTISRACARGILVISFDQVVTAPCAWKLQSNWNAIPRVLAAWLARQLRGRGNVFLDLGLAGAPISAQIANGYRAVLRKFPRIRVIGTFNGNYALGPEQSGVASLLSAHPDVDGILTQGYGVGALRALRQANRRPVPVTAFSYNTTAVTCARTRGARCILGSNPAYLSAEAIRLAVRLLDAGNRRRAQNMYLYTPYLTTHPTRIRGYGYSRQLKIRIGRTAFPNLPPGLTLPISPRWVKITPAEAAGSR
jgi:ribose transport system substrate-binding protein